MSKAKYITTTKGMAGYFAVMLWWNTETLSISDGFWEPYESGIGRYVTIEEAAAEGIEWAKCEGLKFIPSGSPLPPECQ